MSLKTLLIANRGEIACRIARAAAGLGIRHVPNHAQAVARPPHAHKPDARLALPCPGLAASSATVAPFAGASRTVRGAAPPRLRSECLMAVDNMC